MIYHYKMQPPTAVGGDGNGTKATPWYWYSKTQGQTVSLNNTGASSSDNYRLYLRVKLKAGTTYSIGQTAPGGGDGKIFLYNQSGTQLTYNDDDWNTIANVQCHDSFSYTPNTTGIYIIGAGAYSGSTGNYTVAINPAPEEDPVPPQQLLYKTSSGFDNWGRSQKSRSSSIAKCPATALPYPQGLLCYFTMKNINQITDSIGGITLQRHGNISSAQGIKNKCVQATTQGDYLYGTQELFKNGISGNFTLNVWVNVTYSGSGNCLVFQFGTYPYGCGFYIDGDRRVSPRFNDDYNRYSSQGLQPNVWNMLTMVKSSGDIYFYINGQLQSHRSGAGTCNGSTYMGAFSRQATGGVSYQYFLGKLDQIGFWNYAMTQQQVVNLMNYYK